MIFEREVGLDVIVLKKMQNSGQTKVSGTRKDENTKATNTTTLQKADLLASLPKEFVDLPASLSDDEDSDEDSLGSEAVDPSFVETASNLLFGQASGQPDLRAVDPETIEAILEAAGIGKSNPFNGKQSFDADAVGKLASKSISPALDEEAEAELTWMKVKAATTSVGGQVNVGGHLMGSLDPQDQDQMMAGRLVDDQKVLQDTEESESLLSLACSGGYFELAQVLLKINANVEDRGSKRDCTPLMEAASAGHVDIVKLLLEHDADVNAQSSAGNTPLMYACSGGHEEIVKILLDHGAKIEDHNENGHTPLMEAASSGHVGIARILLERGAGINTHSTEFKESALTLACYKGHLEMVQFLLDEGADHEHKTDEMHTALMEASMDGHVEVARLLLDHGAQVNMPTDSFESPLTLAACGGHTKLASLLLERGANIEEVNDEGYTPLMEAAREGHEEMVALLLAQGADINAQTEETQETALTLACCGGFLEVAKFLIEVEADIELGCSTPLMEASQEGQVELVKFLLSKGANVHATTATGDTALTYACENGHTDVASLLLDAGADLEHESEGGRTPLMKAARAGHFCSVRFLISKGADVNRATTNNDHTVLSLACAGGHLPVVELLLSHGADPSHKLKDNSTSLIEASKGGHGKVMGRILNYPGNILSSADGTTTPPTPDQGEIPRVPIQALPTVVPPQEPDKHPEELQGTDYQGTIMQDNATDPMDLIPDESLYQQNIDLELAATPSDMMSSFPSSGKPRSSKFRSAEEQILEKQQIIAELQKVERELQQRMEYQQAESKKLARKKEELTSKGKVDCLPEVDGASPGSASSLSLVGSPGEANNNKESPDSPPCANIDSFRADLSLDEREIKLLNGASPPIPHEFEMPHYLDEHGQMELNLCGGREAVASGPQEEPEPGGMTLEQLNQLQGQDNLVQTKDQAVTTHLPDFFLQNFPSYDGIPKGERPITEGQEDLSLLHDELGASINFQNEMEEFKEEVETQTTLPKKSVPQTQSVGTQCGGSPLAHNISQSLSPNSSMSPQYPSAPNSPSGFEPPSFTPHPPVEVDAQTESNHDTALTIACAGGYDDLVKMLLEKNADIEHRDKKGFTPLILAATAGHYKTVRILLDAGADIEAQSERTKDTPLSLACSGGRYEVVELLLKHGANKEHRNVSDYTPLSLAASGGYVNIIKLLLKSGAEINSRTGSKLGISPLMLAAMNGHTPAVKLLLDHGSDINAQIETNRNTALTLACFQGRTEVVSLLVDRKANVEHRAKTGLTPLMEAASGGYAEVGSVLINKGADVNAPPVPSSRDTALTIAADKGHYKFVELLLHHKAAVDVKNKKGQSPLWLACNGGHLDVVQLLVKEGADIDSQDNRKMSCLMAAFRKGHVKVVRWMVKHVNQFPSDAECLRFIATISDKELHKKCSTSFEIIVVAKDRQAAEANKNANSLLEELETEKTREETRKAAAAKRREKKRKKRKEKQQKTTTSSTSPEPSKEEEEEEEEEDSPPSSTAESLEERVPLEPPSATTTTTIGPVRTTDTIRTSGAKKSKMQLVTSASSTVTTSVLSSTTASYIMKSAPPASYDNAGEGGKEKGAEDEKRNEKRQKIRERKEMKKKGMKLDARDRRAQEENTVGRKGTKKKLAKEGRQLNHSLREGEYNGLTPIDGSKKSPVSGDSAHQTLIGNFTSASPKRGQRREEGWKEVVRRSKKVIIPSSSISRVIGRNGVNINAIRDVTGAHIDVERQNNKGGERNINIKGSAEATRQASQLITALIKEPDKDISELMAKIKKNNNAAQLTPTASVSSSHPLGTSSQSQKSVPLASSLVGPRLKNATSTQSSNAISKPPPSQATISQYLPRSLAVSSQPPRAPVIVSSAQSTLLPRATSGNMRWGAPQVKKPTQPVAPLQPEITTFQAPVQPTAQQMQPSPSAGHQRQSFQQPQAGQDTSVTPSKNVVRCLFKQPASQEQGSPAKQPIAPTPTPVQEPVFQGTHSSSLFSSHTSVANLMPGAIEKGPQAQSQGILYATAPIGPISKPVTVDSSQAYVPDNPSQASMGKGSLPPSSVIPMTDQATLKFMMTQDRSDLWGSAVGHHPIPDNQPELNYSSHHVPTQSEESKAPGYKRLSAPPGTHIPPMSNALTRSHTYGGQGSAAHQMYQMSVQHQGYQNRIHHSFGPADEPTLNPSSFAPQMPEINSFAPISPENHTPTPPPNGSPVSPGASPRSGTTSPSQEKKVMMPIGTERHKQHHQRKTPVGFPASMGGDLVNPLGSTGGGSIWSYSGDKGSSGSSWYGTPDMDETSSQIPQGGSVIQNSLPMGDRSHPFPGQMSMVPQMNAYLHTTMDMIGDTLHASVPPPSQMPYQPGLPLDSNGLWNPQIHQGQSDQSMEWMRWGQQTM